VVREADSDDDEDADEHERLGGASVDGGTGIKMTDMKRNPPPAGDKIDDEFVDDLLFN